MTPRSFSKHDFKSGSITVPRKIKNKHHRVRTEVTVDLESLWKIVVIKKSPKEKGGWDKSRIAPRKYIQISSF